MIDQDARDRRGSPDRFGYEWEAYSEIRPEYEEQFRRWTVHLAPGDWRGRSFLDVGCGMGRNSYWPMTYGARGGVAIDVDDASLAAARKSSVSPSAFSIACVARHCRAPLQFTHAQSSA